MDNRTEQNRTGGTGGAGFSGMTIPNPLPDPWIVYCPGNELLKLRPALLEYDRLHHCRSIIASVKAGPRQADWTATVYSAPVPLKQSDFGL